MTNKLNGKFLNFVYAWKGLLSVESVSQLMKSIDMMPHFWVIFQHLLCSECHIFAILSDNWHLLLFHWLTKLAVASVQWTAVGGTNVFCTDSGATAALLMNNFLSSSESTLLDAILYRWYLVDDMIQAVPFHIQCGRKSLFGFPSCWLHKVAFV